MKNYLILLSRYKWQFLSWYTVAPYLLKILDLVTLDGKVNADLTVLTGKVNFQWYLYCELISLISCFSKVFRTLFLDYCGSLATIIGI